MPTGVYRITAELQGFATITQGELELLMGQQAVINLQLAPSAVQESVTVTGEAPLIDVNGILEMFNVFNHANYGSYVTQESASNYGSPQPNTNVAYAPRMLQLGIRVNF